MLDVENVKIFLPPKFSSGLPPSIRILPSFAVSNSLIGISSSLPLLLMRVVGDRSSGFLERNDYSERAANLMKEWNCTPNPNV